MEKFRLSSSDPKHPARYRAKHAPRRNAGTKALRRCEMTDWKEQVRQREEQNAREERVRREAMEAPRLAREEAERERKRKKEEEKWGRKFYCRIPGCTTRSNGPRRVRTGDPFEEDKYKTINKPNMLEKCKKCGKWTCYEHLYQYICKACWG